MGKASVIVPLKFLNLNRGELNSSSSCKVYMGNQTQVRRFMCTGNILLCSVALLSILLDFNVMTCSFFTYNLKVRMI